MMTASLHWNKTIQNDCPKYDSETSDGEATVLEFDK